MVRQENPDARRLFSRYREHRRPDTLMAMEPTAEMLVDDAVAERHSSPILCWSRRGEVACGTHAPERSSPRWVSERWADVPPDVRKRPSGAHFQCQHCSESGSPIIHRPRYEQV